LPRRDFRPEQLRLGNAPTTAPFDGKQRARRPGHPQGKSCMSTQEITKTKQETLAQWLRDAHAMEEQALTMLDGLARRLEHYPELKARIVQHYKETESQEKRLKSCIDRYGGTSAVKVAIGKVMGMMQSLSGVLASDE